MEARAHKKENRPIKQGLKKTQKAAHHPGRKDPDTREGSRRPGKAGTRHHSFRENLPTRTVKKYLVIPQSATLTHLASKACLCCAQHNLGQGPKPLLLIQKKGVYPFQHLEMDFTEIQPSKTYWYLLVVVCFFTGWVGAYPTCMEKPAEVSRALAKEIIPRFGVPSSIESDNRPALVSLVIKGISHAVGLT
jgi:hypothetical protein